MDCPALYAASHPHFGIGLRAMLIPSLATGNDGGPRRSSFLAIFSRRHHQAPPRVNRGYSPIPRPEVETSNPGASDALGPWRAREAET